MLPLAYFGIESSGLSLIIDLLIVFLVVLYLSLVYWTYMDARRRIEDPMMIGCAVGASLFPFAGTIVYIILRPPEYLEDVRERELEIQAAQARLYELDNGLCPHCGYRVERDFIRCPSCLRKLKERCVSCGRPIDRTWSICPYCEADVPDAASTRRRRRRRAQTADGDPALPSASPRRGSALESPALESSLDGAPRGSSLDDRALDSSLETSALGSSLEEPAALDGGSRRTPGPGPVSPGPVSRGDRRDDRSQRSASPVSPAGDPAVEDEPARPVAPGDHPPPRPRGGRSRYPRSST